MNIESFKKNIKEFDLDVNFKKFCNFNMFEVGSWSQVVMHCALQGDEVDFDTVKFFLYCSIYMKNVREMFLHTLKETDFLDDYLNVDFMNVVYKVTNIVFLSNNDDIKLTYKMTEFFTELSKQFDRDVYYGEQLQESDRFVFFDAIDKKKPMLLLQFFVANKRQLWQFEDELVRYIYARTKEKAKINADFAKIYQEMLKDKEKQLKLNMFMN